MTAFFRARIASLQRQHKVVLALVTELTDRIARMGKAPERADAYQMTLLLAKLTGIVRIHLAQEDSLLYPALMTCEQGEVAAAAHAFSDEMSQIGPIFTAWSKRWCATEAILGDVAAFARESAALFAALGDRIAREDNGLYPLVDTLDQDDPLARVA